MDGAIGVPHGIVAIILSCPIGKHTVGKRRISTIHITHLTRQETAAIKGTIELIHASRIRILYINRVQTVHPLLGQLLHHTLKVVTLCLKGKVVFCSSFSRKRRGRLQDDRHIGFTWNREPSTKAVAPGIHDFIVCLKHKMAAESSRLTPTLIDAMYRIIAIDCLGQMVYLQVALTLVAVMIQEDVYRSILLWGDTEDGRMTAACHLHLQMLLRQTDGIVMWMRDLFCM